MGLGSSQCSLLVFSGNGRHWGQSILPAKRQPLLGMEKQPSVQALRFQGGWVLEVDRLGYQTWFRVALETLRNPLRLCIRNRNTRMSPGMNNTHNNYISQNPLVEQN